MRKVVIFGAGLSSLYLIRQLEKESERLDFQLHVVDSNEKAIEQCVLSHKTSKRVVDINDEDNVNQLITDAFLVISMLPVRFHLQLAEKCLYFGCHFATASYLTEEIQNLHQDAIDKNVSFIMECGLDPGLDHIFSMIILDDLRSEGYEIESYESFAGALLSPKSPPNPWQYKFTWNPRNVVLAGSGGAVKFLDNGKYKYIPYQRLFRRTEIVHTEDYGRFEGYANRDSLKYQDAYSLQNIKTIYRGTLRRLGFCRAWNHIVNLGATDDSYSISDVTSMTHRDFTNCFLTYHPTDSVEVKLGHYLNIAQDDFDIWDKLESIGLFSDEKIGLSSGTPAQILEHILKKKWTLLDDEMDLVVMHFRIKGVKNDQTVLKTADFSLEGKNAQDTAISKTVGLPLAAACVLLLENVINQKGCFIPVSKDVYEPIWQYLQGLGFSLKIKSEFIAHNR